VSVDELMSLQTRISRACELGQLVSSVSLCCRLIGHTWLHLWCQWHIDPRAAENSPYPLKLYLPPKIHRKKVWLSRISAEFWWRISRWKNSS